VLQVKAGGRLISPVEYSGGDQMLMVYDKSSDGSVQQKRVRNSAA
jgi:protein-L-isoaspartate O-methyltransferase